MEDENVLKNINVKKIQENITIATFICIFFQDAFKLMVKLFKNLSPLILIMIYHID